MNKLSSLVLAATAVIIQASPTPVEHVDTTGTPTIETRTTRTSNPGGCLEVQGSNPTSSQYGTIASAVASLSGTDAQCIFIWPGTYNEQVTVQYGGPLTIYGYTTE